jgi:hypothetical protein
MSGILILPQMAQNHSGRRKIAPILSRFLLRLGVYTVFKRQN